MNYDSVGNLIEDKNGKRRFEYDVTNRLTACYKKGQLKATYSYNALGQRIKKTLKRKMDASDDHKTMHFTYLRSGWLLSEDGHNTQGHKTFTRDYIWLGGQPIAQIESKFNKKGKVKKQQISYIHADHLNTPRLATDNNQNIVWRWESDAFGEQKAEQDPDGDGKKTKICLRFPGQYFDKESRLHYNHYRDYDPKIGRYIQSDPIGLEGGVNRYAYVLGNPLKYVDVNGLMSRPPPTPSPREIAAPCINSSSLNKCILCCVRTYRYNLSFSSICKAECGLKNALGGFDGDSDDCSCRR